MIDALSHAIDAIDPGPWAVGVSGGIDSTALLHALVDRRRSDLAAIAHYNHGQRGRDSDADEQFVRDLGERLGVAVVCGRYHGSSPTLNRSAVLRAARIAFFRSVVLSHSCRGVLLAHHADDQAETVLLRLMRGGGLLGLAGIANESRHDDLRIVHPLLTVRRADLLAHLNAIGATWCEDTTNASPGYARNRIRQILRGRPALVVQLLEIGRSARAISAQLRTIAPRLPEAFPVGQLADLPAPIARWAARRWLTDQGATQRDLNDEVCDRLVSFAADASAGAAMDLPGVHIRRRRGFISAAPATGAPPARRRQSRPSTDPPAPPARSTPPD